MSALADFTPVTEVTVDSRDRVAIGKTHVRRGSRYAVSERADGSILLTPISSIPTRELLVWENEDVRASLFRGLAEAAENNTMQRPDVTEGIDLSDLPAVDDA